MLALWAASRKLHNHELANGVRLLAIDGHSVLLAFLRSEDSCVVHGKGFKVPQVS